MARIKGVKLVGLTRNAGDYAAFASEWLGPLTARQIQSACATGDMH